MSYLTDRVWSERFIPQIKQLVGPLLLEVAPLDLDRTEATDLLVFCARDMRIAARVRKHKYFENYSSHFTIRCERDSGCKTELAKVVEGWGDWMFYGFANADEDRIEHWRVIDLAAFRAALIRHNMNGYELRYGTVANGDGTHFRWFDVRSFEWCDPPLLVAASPSLLGEAA